MTLNQYVVLVVDDNPGDADLASERLAEAPGCAFRTHAASTLAQALAAIAASAPEAVILDLNLPDSFGLDTLHAVRAAAPLTPVIVVSGAVDGPLRERALEAGAEDVLAKNETTGRLFSRTVMYVIERQRARLEHQQLLALLDAMPDAMLAIGAGGEVRFVNPAALSLLGRSREEMLRERLAFSIQEGAAFELVLPRPGDPRICELRVAAMEWNGERVHLAAMRDITERRQAETLRQRSDELELQNARMRQASELKSAFVAHMSHEIRTPMNAVIGLTHLLGQSRLDDDQRAMLTGLQTASGALMGLLDNVLDLSKIEAGQVAIESLPFELPAALAEPLRLLEPQARQKGLTLTLELDPQLPRWVRGDPTRLRQVLTNLLGNAVKFTDQGSVTLAAAPHPDDPARLRFVVRDTGIGIPAEAQARLFTPFAQAENSTTRRFGGTGLGLSISRDLAGLMGGSIAVRSQPGCGSEFTLELPLGRPGDGEATVPDVRLLCVGCAGGSRLAGSAGQLGWQIETLPAATPAALRDRLARAPLPDALVFDPAAAPWVRATLDDRPAGAAAPPAVPLPCDRAGTATLFNAVCATLRQQGHDGSAVLAGTRIDTRRLRWLAHVRLLVVDDSALNLEVARRLLERAGAQVEVCADARSALQRLAGPGPQFDGVLMDVQMPGLDGIEATRAIRGQHRLRGLPIVALTAGALVADRQRALEAGMDDFLTKPLDPALLVRTLRRLVERHRGELLAVEDCGAVPVLDEPWPTFEGFDRRAMPERFGGDLALFVRLSRHMFEEFADFAGLPLPADAPARRGLAARAHRLRGTAGLLGLVRIQALAGRLEAGLAAGSPNEPDPLDELVQAMAAARRHIETWAASRPGAGSEALPAGSDIADHAQLLALLRDRDLAAVACLRRLDQPLRSSLGEVRFDAVRRAVEGLDFARALDLLADLETGRGRVPADAAA